MQALGVTDVTDHEVVKKFLRSLNDVFETLVLMIQERPNYKNIAPTDVLERLNTYELQLDEKRELYGSTSQRNHALKATTDSSFEDEVVSSDGLVDPDSLGKDLTFLLKKLI